ncbi:unnamed protein product [Rotaria magnacalcarata]
MFSITCIENLDGYFYKILIETMGNTAFRERRIPQIPEPMPHNRSYYRGQSDFVPRSRNFVTSEAPWNVTEWIDPIEPHPRLTSVPVLLVVRK